MNKQQEAKELILAECKRNYNTGGCFTKCRCRNSQCIGTDKDNKWNENLIPILKEGDFIELQTKRDRLREVKKQIIKYANKKDWFNVKALRVEQKILQVEIKDIESKRGVINE